MKHWIVILLCCAVAYAEDGFVSLMPKHDIS